MKFRQRTIKKDIFFASAFQTIAAIILVGVISSFIMLRILKTQTFNDKNTFFENSINTIDNYSSEIFNLSQSLLYDDKFIDSTLSEADADFYDITSLNNIFTENSDIKAIKLVLGDYEYDFPQGKKFVFSKNSIVYNKLKEQLTTSNKKFLWHVAYQNNEKSDIFFVRQIKNPYTNEHKGMLFFQISSRTFSNLVKSPQNGEKGLFSILSATNLPIAQSCEVPSEILNKHNTEDSVISFDGKYYFCKYLPDFNWKIIYSIDKWDLYKSLYLLIALVAFLCMIYIIVAIIFVQHINRTIISPIQNLSTTMNNWEENTSFILSKSSNISEINELYGNFENMSARISDLIDKNYKAMLVQRESELKSLQSQINPHFIFNTLEAINSFALIYDADEISKITTAFSDLIEQSICYPSNIEHTFAHELHLVDCYLTIIQIRYGNKIIISKDIDSNLLNILMRNLLLQPIVENAVKHGIIPSGRVCELKISACKSGSDLIIKVRDTGSGMNKETVDTLNQLFINDDNTPQKSIGLINVNKRLKLLYGDKYHLKISSELNKFTEVELKIGEIK